MFDPAITDRAKQIAFQTAKWALHQDRKYAVLRVVHGEKKPITLDHNYTDRANFKVPEASEFESGLHGIGIITGPERNGPLDVDLDALEALFFGACFLPPTPAIFGRASKPRSHWLYTDENASNVPTLKFNDPVQKSSIVEFRGDGGNHTVAPGSIHASGEIVQWDKEMFPNPAKIVSSEVARCCAKIAMAVLVSRHLWETGTRNETVLCLAGMFFYMRWPLPEAEEFIRAVCEFTKDDASKNRITNVRATYSKGERGEKIRGATYLKTKVFPGNTEVETIVACMLDWMGPTASSVVMEMNETFACVTLSSSKSLRICRTDVAPGDAFAFQSKDDFFDTYGPFLVTGYDGKPVSKAKLWFNSSQRRFYHSAEFMPGVIDHPTIFNLWSGWAVEPDPNGTCEAWLNLLWEVVCGQDEGLYNWLINWFAHMFQFPLEKAHTCPVITGIQGAGKSLLNSYLSRILGSAYMQITKPEHIHGRFNAHLRTTLLLHSDEALSAREKKHRAVIKSLITDERQVHEQKGVDASFVRSYVRLLLTSNDDDAAPTEERDRRFTVINMQTRQVSKALRNALLAERDANGPAALLHYLLTWPVDKEWVHQNIKNKDWYDSMIEQSEPVVNWWQERLQTGILVPEYLVWATKPDDNPWPSVVGIPALYHYFVEDSKSSGRSWGKMSQTAFSNQLNKMTGGTRKKHMKPFFPPVDDDTAPRWVRELPGSQKAILDLPPLRECRVAFGKFVGHATDWDDPTLHVDPETSTPPPGRPDY